MEELIQDFSIGKISKSGAIFNIDKLDWMNGIYIRNMDINELTKKCLPYLKEKEGIDNRKVIEAYKDRLKKLSDITELADYLYEERLEYDKESLKWKDMTNEEVKESLNKSLELIENIQELDKGSIQTKLVEEAQKASSVGSFMWPLRVALSGKKASAGPAEIIEIIGKDKSIKRIRDAINSL
jgi:glutamyl/glutaminyl-tRNA synthetase